jgi:hypothetical protein
LRDAGIRLADAELSYLLDKLHGPYPPWTRKVDNKTITRALTPEQAERYHPWLDNNWHLRRLPTELASSLYKPSRTAKAGGRKKERDARKAGSVDRFGQLTTS